MTISYLIISVHVISDHIIFGCIYIYNCWKKSKLKSYVRPWFHGYYQSSGSQKLTWFTDKLCVPYVTEAAILEIHIIHETMVVHMTWVWTFFNNYSNHPRMCVLSTLCGSVDIHSLFYIYIYMYMFISCQTIFDHIIYLIISYLIISCLKISCHVISYLIISYESGSYQIIPYHIISYIISYRIVSYRNVPHHTTSHLIISYHISHHIISYTYNFWSYIRSYHIISNHIISDHIISDHIISAHILSDHKWS